MKTTKLTAVAIAMGAFSMFALTPVIADDAKDNQEKVPCTYKNAAGMEETKNMTKAECDKMTKMVSPDMNKDMKTNNTDKAAKDDTDTE